jgi:hypothetical protein
MANESVRAQGESTCGNERLEAHERSKSKAVVESGGCRRPFVSQGDTPVVLLVMSHLMVFWSQAARTSAKQKLRQKVRSMY